jgi:predicted HicB family RNase H-like nuclease
LISLCDIVAHESQAQIDIASGIQTTYARCIVFADCIRIEWQSTIFASTASGQGREKVSGGGSAGMVHRIGSNAMMNAMTYKGYLGKVGFDPADNIFVGHVLGVSDRITFHGETVAGLTADFRKAVDHYLDDCEKTGREPQKAASGKLMLRIRPEVHAAVSVAAAAAGKSISQWADEVLDQASHAFG